MYNPFTTVNNGPLYFTYVRWNGQKDLAGIASGPVESLQLHRTYRVSSIHIHSWHTELTLVDIATGHELTGSYNSVLFEPLKSSMAIARSQPNIGEAYYVSKIDGNKLVDWRTSSVVGVEYVSKNIVNVITQNSVYCVQLVP